MLAYVRHAGPGQAGAQSAETDEMGYGRHAHTGGTACAGLLDPAGDARGAKGGHLGREDAGATVVAKRAAMVPGSCYANVSVAHAKGPQMKSA